MINRNEELRKAIKKFFDKRALFDTTWGGEKSQNSQFFRLSMPYWSKVPSPFLRVIREENHNFKQDILKKFYIKTQTKK